MPESGDARQTDAVFDRSVVLSQLIFGLALVVVLFTLQVLAVEGVAGPVALGGIALAFGVTGATVVVPWHRLPRDVVMAVPILDMLAIGVIRLFEPSAGIGLLWVFPTIWLASSFGLRGVIIAISITGAFVWIPELVMSGARPLPASIAATLLLPTALVFVAVSAYLTARRATAQRELLGVQARQLERALRRANLQEERLAELINAVEFGVVRLDREGRGAVMNAAYARMHRLDLADPQSASGGLSFAADRSTPLRPEELPFNRAAAGDEFDDVLTWVPDGAGELRAIAVTGRVLHDDEGEADGSVIVARDVTAELRALRARDDLVASVSHELRTPLTSMLGYVDLSLEDPALPADVRRNLEIMERNGERMLELVASILHGAKQANQPVPLALGPMDLGAVVREAVEALRPRSDERGIEVRVTVAEHVVIRADTLRIRQIVDNLLSNAIKYNRDDGEVTIGVTADAGKIWIVVRDTGIGIGESELPRVFDRFFRADAVRQGSVHGSGLGLGIVRELVERHGGTIEIDSEAESGTTVVVTLPQEGPGDA